MPARHDFEARLPLNPNALGFEMRRRWTLSDLVRSEATVLRVVKRSGSYPADEARRSGRFRVGSDNSPGSEQSARLGLTTDAGYLLLAFLWPSF